ncbi:hypothetical protein [Oceanisphaera sp. KMM 10153]|uniref:hypothetical protein n=1 Tax=Oceanisphaera submarina TaxID=3390193 RepID=UPI003975B5E3
MIELTHLLRNPAVVRHSPLRPEVVVHRHRPGFIERQDGSWICLPVHNSKQARKQNKPKARRRLWHWLAGQLSAAATAKQGDVA